MSKIVVVYESKYGSTKKYAQWLAKELEADLFDRSKMNGEKLEEYDIIIFGGGLYASGIAGVSLIKKNYQRLKDKVIVVFTVGLASTDNKEVFVPIIDKNFKKEIQDNIHFFHLRGGIDYQNIGMIHNMMMRMLRSTLVKKSEDQLTQDDKELLATFGKKVDYTHKETLEPMITFINNKKME